MQIRKFATCCWSILLPLLLLNPLHAAHAQNGSAPATGGDQKPSGTSSLLMVPVTVHLLHSELLPAANSHLKGDDVLRIFQKANKIWKQAGVYLYLDHIVSEPCRPVPGYEHAETLPYQALLALRPENSKQAGMFHVYYINEFPANGIFMQTDGIFVKETAMLQPVEGGIDEPLPRVTAHELGHGMGLPHRQNITNLMASGTTGTSLNAEEVAAVHRTLEKLPWVQTPAQFLDTADHLLANGKRAEAVAHYRAVLELPVDSPLKKRAREKLGKK